MARKHFYCFGGYHGRGIRTSAAPISGFTTQDMPLGCRRITREKGFGMAELGAGLRGRKVLVTGASGFIGRRLVAALCAAGAEVTALGRTRQGATVLGPQVRFVRGSLADPGIVASAVADHEVIFNLAYDFRQSAAANVANLEGLVQAAEAEGRARIIHTSSIVVYDDWPGGKLTEASTLVRPDGSPYRRAKIAMEARLMAGRLPAAILQPTIVWGPGSSLWTDGFAEALLAGGVVLPEPEGLCQGVYVEDVVQACLRAATLPDLGRERFIINGLQPFAWSALIGGYSAILGRGKVQFAPAATLAPAIPHGQEPDSDADDHPSVAARISALGRRVLGHARFEALVRTVRRRLSRGKEMRPDAHLYELMVAKGDCPPDMARARLGYLPDYDLAKGLAACRDHLQRMAG